jgi:hypothetical protein
LDFSRAAGENNWRLLRTTQDGGNGRSAILARETWNDEQLSAADAAGYLRDVLAEFAMMARDVGLDEVAARLEDARRAADKAVSGEGGA